MADPEVLIDVTADAAAVLIRRPAPKRSWVERAVLSAGILGTTIALLAAGVLNWGLSKLDAIEEVPIAPISAAEDGEPANWLLVGSDSRDGIDADDPRSGIFLGDEVPGGKRTDTMVIARVDPDGGVINLLSIPRDLWVPIAGKDQSGRVNTAFNGEAGEERLVETIEEYFNIEINHYAEINFVGFQDIVDALDGVPIWFDHPMRDPGSALDVPSAGCQVLDGFDALAFARGRKMEYFENGSWQFDPTGDLGRTSRQQYFIRQVAATATRKLDFTSFRTVNRLLDAVGQNLTISGTTVDDLVGLARVFSAIEGEQIIGHSLPVYDFRTEGGAAVLGLELDQAQPLLNVFRSAESAVVVETTTSTVLEFTVLVLNGSQVSGQAGETSEALADLGFSMSIADNAEPVDKTTISYGEGLEAAATDVARYLGIKPVLEFDAELSEVVVTTGSDFAGVLTIPRSEDSPSTTTPGAAAAPTEPLVTVAPAVTVGIVPGPSPAGTLCE